MRIQQCAYADQDHSALVEPDIEEVELRFDPQEGVVDFFLTGFWIYDLDLNEFREPAEALDWIRQISQKRWMSKQAISQVCTLALEVLKNAR